MTTQLTRRGQAAFTLIELLVVVAIIALLISILLPSLSRARTQARTVTCSANLHDIGIALTSYYNDHDWRYPKQNLLQIGDGRGDAGGFWGMSVHKILAEHMGGLQYDKSALASDPDNAERTQTHKVFYCPFVPLEDMDHVDQIHGPEIDGVGGHGATNAEEQYLHIAYVYLAGLQEGANDPALRENVPGGISDSMKSDMLEKRKHYVKKEGSSDDVMMMDSVVAWTGGNKWRINHGAKWQNPWRRNYPPKLESANIMYGDGHVETQKSNHFPELTMDEDPGTVVSTWKSLATLEAFTSGGILVWW